MDILAIFEPPQLYVLYLRSELVVESDSSNAIAWVVSFNAGSWNLQFFLNEMKKLSSLLQVVFKHIANGLTDSLAKQGF